VIEEDKEFFGSDEDADPQLIHEQCDERRTGARNTKQATETANQAGANWS
jgi:hypothetical protein